jgi:hypothetical protein
MWKRVPIASAFFATATVWGQIQPVAITAGQTVRLKVTAAAEHSCSAQLGFVDRTGNPIGPAAQVSLQAGQSTAVELPSSAVLKEHGERAEIQPRVTPDPGTLESACHASAAVLESGAKPSRGSGEGVRVHGHWTIEVLNPDGTLVTHHEFENSLQSAGAQALIASLARLTVIGTWSIVLQGSFCPPGCFINEQIDLLPTGPGFSNDLMFYVPTSGPNTGKFVLAGNITAPATGTISDVVADLNSCFTDVTPFECSAGTSGASDAIFTFASHSLGVTAGQLIQVTAVFGFS